MTRVGTHQPHGRLGDTRHAQVRAQRKHLRTTRNSPKRSPRRASREPRGRHAHVECARREGMLARADARAARTTRVRLHHEAARADAAGAQQREREQGEAPRHVGSGKLKKWRRNSRSPTSCSRSAR